MSLNEFGVSLAMFCFLAILSVVAFLGVVGLLGYVLTAFPAVPA